MYICIPNDFRRDDINSPSDLCLTALNQVHQNCGANLLNYILTNVTKMNPPLILEIQILKERHLYSYSNSMCVGFFFLAWLMFIWIKRLVYSHRLSLSSEPHRTNDIVKRNPLPLQNHTTWSDALWMPPKLFDPQSMFVSQYRWLVQSAKVRAKLLHYVRHPFSPSVADMTLSAVLNSD